MIGREEGVQRRKALERHERLLLWSWMKHLKTGDPLLFLSEGPRIMERSGHITTFVRLENEGNGFQIKTTDGVFHAAWFEHLYLIHEQEL